jgi:aminopeptidase N
MAAPGAGPTVKYRKDYKPTSYLLGQVNLNFNLNEETSRVRSKLEFVPNYEGSSPPEIFLNGRKDVKLVSVKVDGNALSESDYKLAPDSLTILSPPSGSFQVEIETELKPQDNTSLEGLYKSSGNFCTQCEAEGFRGITYYYDRPDVLANMTTRIEADKEKYPVLLGNGNLIDSGDLDGGRHFAVWDDPFKKPCYLFAVVAGNLAVHRDTFTTMSGKKVDLAVYVEHRNIEKVHWAMRSLQQAMKWDEDTFGLEYDLGQFSIVAVDDFTMGAMENKSLNIFNSRLVLASPQTATDLDYERIEGVVGHEYFHNWTGNRVTCRDWFQLTLKEGLTVFRDQEFTADMTSRAVKRINDVSMLRASQFSEDAGPMAHPIRPDSYLKMDNFYTLTVYEKGAEVVRIYRTLLGKDGFRKGMDLYFQRHDGSAVTCDDFLAAMADANGEDLSMMSRWYEQAGTPALTVSPSYNESAQTFTLDVKQSLPPTPGQPSKQPVLIPLAVALLGPDGKELPLRLQGGEQDLGTSTVLRVDAAEKRFVFEGVTAQPVPSLLRNFSAPVKMEVIGQTDEDLTFLLAHDTDLFSRWEASQRLGRQLLLSLYVAAAASKDGSVEERIASAGGVSAALVDAYRSVLTESGADGAFVSAAISLPSTSELLDDITDADPLLLHEVRKVILKEVTSQLRPELEAIVAAQDAELQGEYSPDSKSAARRAIKNKALAYLSMLKDPAVTADILKRFRGATNMTDKIAMLAALSDTASDERETALSEFYEEWKEEGLVTLKWLGLQAGSNVPGNVSAVTDLLSHPAFNINNPNNCYSLFLGFARSPVNFHAEDGSGYKFMGDSILKVDKINPQVAARMTSAFTQWRKFDGQRQQQMKDQLQKIVNVNGLSENVFEIASKSLE